MSNYLKKHQSNDYLQIRKEVKSGKNVKGKRNLQKDGIDIIRDKSGSLLKQMQEKKNIIFDKSKLIPTLEQIKSEQLTTKNEFQLQEQKTYRSIETQTMEPQKERKKYKKEKYIFENSPYYLNYMKKKSVVNKIPSAQLQINTLHCKAELQVLRNIIEVNNWKEVNQVGKGHIAWYSNALSDIDKQIVNNRSIWYNRYIGSSFLTYKRSFSQILKQMQRLF